MQVVSRADEGFYHSRFTVLSTVVPAKKIFGWGNGGFYSQFTSLNVSVR